MLSESIRTRLEALNRAALPAGSGPLAREATPLPTAAPPVAGQGAAASATRGLLTLAEVEATQLGECLVIRAPLAEFWPEAPGLVAPRLAHLAGLDPQKLHPDMAAFVAAMPGGVVAVDLETCGLAGSALFLVGLLRDVGGELMVELLFARHYGEEAGVVAAVWDRLDRAEVVLTYNGKSFDWPTLLDRSRRHLLHKRRAFHDPHHVDVLHHARRRYKKLLPDCRLQTLEARVCRRRRGVDLPSAQVPAAYEAFVRTGRPEQVEGVLWHNALDLVTLLDLTLRLAS